MHSAASGSTVRLQKRKRATGLWPTFYSPQSQSVQENLKGSAALQRLQQRARDRAGAITKAWIAVAISVVVVLGKISAPYAHRPLDFMVPLNSTPFQPTENFNMWSQCYCLNNTKPITPAAWQAISKKLTRAQINDDAFVHGPGQPLGPKGGWGLCSAAAGDCAALPPPLGRCGRDGDFRVRIAAPERRPVGNAPGQLELEVYGRDQAGEDSLGR